MIQITYLQMATAITIIWLLTRGIICVQNRRIDWKREALLILVYICIVVVARFTFFPFSKIDGQIQPLIFDVATAFPPRINLIPFINLMDYPEKRDAILNFVGNTTMFIPIGIVWPIVFKKLDTHKKVILAGAGFSLLIEILQLPFFDRVSDIDDLILNSVGFLVGYGIYIVVNKCIKRTGTDGLKP